MPITRTPISELSSVIYEYCVIKLNSNHQVDYIEHHLNDDFVLNREIELSPQVGRNVYTPLTNIDTLSSKS